ncbi:MAG: glycosyltransferase family 4 protein [Rhodospirillaceae bacterium]|nr:glycosyltransferase family 4 protein [Rhodospirillaceae bacterium]
MTASEVWFAIPGDLAALTGGYGYARRLIAALPEAGWRAHHVALPASFPDPSADDLAATRNALARVPPDVPVLVDGLAFGAFPEDLFEALPLTWVALVHHPLARETGLADHVAARLHVSEQLALARARTVIATSAHTADVLRVDYGVAADRLTVAPPGTDPAPRARAANPVPHLLTVATLTPRKGHADLARALAEIADLPWRCSWVGSADRDPPTATSVRALIEAHGLRDRIALRGELNGPALDAVYADADVFVLPSKYEGYGMAFAEALARGLPVVGCAAGAVPATVPTDAGLLVPPGDSRALGAALRRVVTDRALRAAMSAAAWAHGRRLPTWADTAATVARALRAVAS